MRYILIIFVLFIGFSSCKKADNGEDPNAMGYNASNQYCNDPEAINYNYDFPGTANNYVCIYPTDPFVGVYSLMDTVYTADYASYYVLRDTISIYATSITKMAITGLCGPQDSLRLTAGRYYKASVDTTIGNGQMLCSNKDTLNGTVDADTLGLKIRFTLFSDTAGIKFHMGRATKID
jgi:hypothetical protein